MNTYSYSPFGELIVEQEEVKLNIGFNTKYEDESGLIYYNNRYYDSDLGRFISQDPIFEEGGINLYNFVENDPINHWDILGMFPVSFSFFATIPDNLGVQASGVQGLPSNLQEYSWLLEPPFDNGEYFNSGEKVRINTRFNSNNIGNLESNVFNEISGISIEINTTRGENGQLIYESTTPLKLPSLSVDTEVVSSNSQGSVEEGGTWTSVLNYDLATGYPYLPSLVVADIDTEFTLTATRTITYEVVSCPVGSPEILICRNRIETITISLSGEHNNFPNYDITGDLSYSFLTISDGSGSVNLNTSTDFSVSSNIPPTITLLLSL